MATRYHVGYTSNSMLINNKELILLEVLNLKKYFPIKKGILQREIAQIKAVDAINFTIKIGETLGIVGESGCGKTTLGRTVLQLIKPTSGTVNFRSKRLAEKGKEFKFLEISNVSSKVLKLLRSEMQIIFQDPYSSLNPRLKVGTVLEEPLLVHTNLNKSERIERVKYLLNAVGLKSEHMQLHPHEFSGGQRQRIGIARSLASEPQLVVADEPVSALDVSIQAQVINLLQDLQQEFGLTYLFISHDLSVIKYICQRICVMYLGKIVEIASTNELFSNPKHPYTEALISSVLTPHQKKKQRRFTLKGDVPNPSKPPSGCHFHPRCVYSKPACENEQPDLKDFGGGHFVSCLYADSLKLNKH